MNLTQTLIDFDDKKLFDASKEDLKMSVTDDKDKKRDKELQNEFEVRGRFDLSGLPVYFFVSFIVAA